MPLPALSDDACYEALRLLTAHNNNTSSAAKSAGLSRTTFQSRVKVAHERGLVAPDRKPFDVDQLPSEQIDTETLIDQRKRAFEQKRAAKEARRLIGVRVRIDGPFAVAHMGDPHVDDDGTDIALIERHAATIRKTEGLFGASVGDLQNNWVGRLGRLWAEQGTSAAQSWQLVEWLVNSVEWLYLIGGNHDTWSGEGDPVKWMMRTQAGAYEPHGARLELQTPSGRRFRINARHDFKGHSQWNTAHGPAKAAQMGWRDHVLTCGHLHVSGYQVLKDPATGLISHAIRAASYKTYDRYADELGLPNQNIFVCPVTIFDPAYAEDDPRCVTTIFDPEEGAEFLTWKRAKWRQQKRAA